jgi:hypothetical protein
MGDTCYGLFDDSPITLELRAEYLKTRRAQRFNFVRMTVGHSEARAATNSAFWAWGGTAQKPDLDRFNPTFFRAFDDLMRQLRTNGMNVELLLLNFYRRPFTDTKAWTSARERQWLGYVIARYGAFDNVFLWTIANEYETHPDGRYRLDFPGDVEWAKATARFIKTNDAHRHLVTVHPVISASRRGRVRARHSTRPGASANSLAGTTRWTFSRNKPEAAAMARCGTRSFNAGLAIPQRSLPVWARTGVSRNRC